jgi:hypothetical protein
MRVFAYDTNGTVPSVLVDKILVVNVSKTTESYVYSDDDASTGAKYLDLTFTGDENKTFWLRIPVNGTVPKYVASATFNVEGVDGDNGLPADLYVNMGDNLGNWTNHQWGKLGTYSDNTTTLDLAGEINTYIFNHIDDGPDVWDDGWIWIGFEAYSRTAGVLRISNVTITLGAYVTDPWDADTDGDFLPDRDELDIWHTWSLSWDSDNDGLYDVIEPLEGIGTSPTDSDSENDLLADGDFREINVIFRSGNSSGDWVNYTEDTWIAIPDMMNISLDGVGHRWVPINPRNRPATLTDVGVYVWREDKWSIRVYGQTGGVDTFSGEIIFDSGLTATCSNNDLGGGLTCNEAGHITFDATYTSGPAIGFDFSLDSVPTNISFEFLMGEDGNNLAADRTKTYLGEQQATPLAVPFFNNSVELYRYGYVGWTDTNATTRAAYQTPEDWNFSFDQDGILYVHLPNGSFAKYQRWYGPHPDAELSKRPRLLFALDHR